MEAAKSSAAASEGIALHRFTENLDAGRIGLDDIPDEWRARCALYQQRMTDLGVEWLAIEQILIDDRYEVAGTTDRLGIVDGRPKVLDLKTSKNLAWSWRSIAIQLAIYANHTATYDPTTGQRGPRIDVDTAAALVIHLPAIGPEAGTCTVYEVDIAAGYSAYLTALEVRLWRKTKTKDLATPYQTAATTGRFGLATPATVPAMTPREWLAARVQALAGQLDAVTTLRSRWPDTVPQPLPDNPTAEQIDALALALDRVEALHGIPFGPARPKTDTNKETATA
jgi:hypothetical protein